MHYRFFSAIALTSLLVVTAGAQIGEIETVKGPAVKVGKGKAWSWVKMKDRKLIATGISFTEKALTGLPTDLAMPDMPGMPHPMPSQEFVLELPQEIKGMPYDHIGFDWNPKGHDPMQFYGVPHFDIHFYVLTQDERKSITNTGDDCDRCTKKPEDTYIPATYINPPGTVVPNMGNHWIDPTTPELSGKPFTTTFIYGSYNGKTAFFEPMIAMSYLQSKPNFSQDLKMPKAYDRDGYYPSRYSISFDAKRHEYSIALENLSLRKAGVLLAAGSD